ncbi:LuxR family transcriptional regulator, partial [Micromonospora sp. NPDC049580]
LPCRPHGSHTGPSPVLLDVLAGGHQQRVPGVGARTVRRVVAELTDQRGVSSRFQAGAEAVRHGWI